MDKILTVIKQEEKRQKETLMMIPSENYTYPEVRKALGSVLGHKYSEGQVGKRYYQGNENIDEVEAICKERVLDVFGLTSEDWGVNVQTLSGSPANLAVLNALCEPGDRVLSLYLPDGGHLSHGWQTPMKKITLVSKLYDIHFYHVSKNGKLNYKELAEIAKKVKPKVIISGGTAYPQEIKHARFATIARNAGAYYLADIAHEAGLIAAKAHRSPFPYADVVTMTTHKTLRGPRGAIIVSRKELSPKIDASVFPGIQGGPHNHTIAGIAIALEKTKLADFRNYAFQTIINAKRLAKRLDERGFNIVSGGTEKHLILIDLKNKKVNGAILARALERVGIVINKNTVPNEELPPMYPSGIRLGTPAVTVRGMRERQMDIIAKIIDEVTRHLGERELPRDSGMRDREFERLELELKKDRFYEDLAKEVRKLAKGFPIAF